MNALHAGLVHHSMRLPNWIRFTSDKLAYYTPWHFRSSGLVDCGFSARAGGVSEGCYSSLNLSLAVGDDPEHVLANRRRFASALKLDQARIVVPDQTHSANVFLVTEADAGRGALDHSAAIPDTDALITDTPGLPLALHFADCVGIFLLDPVHRAIGVAHAGWRGTVEGIAAATVEAMNREFGASASDLLAAVTPSIDRHCFEVEGDVANRFARLFNSDERILSPCSATKWRIDLRAANICLLERAGLDYSRIAISEQCTSCQSTEFFSYRRDGQTGRMGGWLSLRHE